MVFHWGMIFPYLYLPSFFKKDRHSSDYLCSDVEAILFTRTCFREIPVFIWRRYLICCWSWEGDPQGTSNRTALQEARRGIHSAELRRRGGGICKGCFTTRALPEPSVKLTRKRKRWLRLGLLCLCANWWKGWILHEYWGQHLHLRSLSSSRVEGDSEVENP